MKTLFSYEIFVTETPKVVILTTFNAASDEHFINITFSFQLMVKKSVGWSFHIVSFLVSFYASDMCYSG